MGYLHGYLQTNSTRNAISFDYHDSKYDKKPQKQINYNGTIVIYY